MTATFHLPVLDHGYVELADITQDVLGSDLKTVNAARVSFDKQIHELRTRDEKLLTYLASNKHYSPFRHSAVSLRVKLPIFVARQWRTHTIASAMADELHSFNEVSGRYVELFEEFYHPATWRTQSADNKQASDGTLADQEQLNARHLAGEVYACAYETYKKLLAKGVAREQARMILPQSLYTSFMWTASLQSIANFIQLRDHHHAQGEIQLYAQAVKAIVHHVFPKSLEALLGVSPPTEEQLKLLSKEHVQELATQHGLLGSPSSSRES
jgi:thymidylate synthase (FAD)